MEDSAMDLYVTSHGQRADLAAKVSDGIRTTIEWRNVFPTRESYERGEPDFSDPERELRPALGLGLGVIPILSTAPDWAGGGEQGIHVDHVIAWRGFVRAMTDTYPEVTKWQVWNEPGHESDTTGVGWDGDPREALTRLYSPLEFPTEPIFGGLARPNWAAALILRKMADYGDDAPIPSFHLNGGDNSLKTVLKRLRRFLAMRQVFGLKGPWVVTECGFNRLDNPDQAEKLLRLLAVLKAAGCSLACIYQLLDQGDGDGLYKYPGEIVARDPFTGEFVAYVNAPPIQPVNGELHARLAARDYGDARAKDLAAASPRVADRRIVRLLHFWGLFRCATGTEGW